MGRQLLVVGIILLAIAIFNTDGYNFGDIISFQTRCKLGIRYKHFALYVGKGNPHGLPKENDDHDIYERNEYPEVKNFDGYTDKKTNTTFQKGSDEEIIERINTTYGNCGLYGLLHNNCEHLATYVRYGHKIAVQAGLTGQGMCLNNPRIDVNAFVNHNFVNHNFADYVEERCTPEAGG